MVSYITSQFLLVTLHLVFSQYTEFPAQNGPIRDMVSQGTHIFVADSDTLILLDNSLQTVAQTNISATTEIFSLSIYNSFLATYDVSGNVNIYNRNTLEHLQNISSLITPPLSKPLDLIGSQSSDDSIQLYLAQSVPIATEDTNKYTEIDLFEFGRDFGAQINQPIRFLDVKGVNREFVAVFEKDGFIYFLVNQQNPFTILREVRVVRVCVNDTFHNNDFSTKYEIILSCLPNENKAQYATHAQLINNKLIVIMSTGRLTNICVFKLQQINLLMDEKYERCSKGEGNEKIGFVRKGQIPCTRLSVRGGVCDLGGYLKNGLEVLDPLTASAIYTHSNGNWIKGMVVVEQNNLELVLLGLITGEVYKMLLHTDRLENIHTYRIYPDIPEKLAYDETSNAIIVQTSHKIYSLPLESCDTIKGCELCLSSHDPICGWCPLINTCTLQSECYFERENLPWVSSVTDNSTNCSSIQLINVPDVISVDDTITQLEIKAIHLPIRSVPYICDFESLGTSEIIQQSDTIFYCPLPTNYNNKLLTPSIDIIVSLRDGTTELLFLSADREITFYNCSQINSCEKCTDTNVHLFSCSWCVYSSTCVDTFSSSCGNSDTIADTIEMCPFLFKTSTPDLVHSQIPTDIMLTGKFLPHPRDTTEGYACVTNGDTFKASYVNSTNIICSDVTFPNPPGVAIEFVWNLDLSWNSYTMDGLGSIEVTSYSCANIADDCSQCESLKFNLELSHYRCGWCGSVDSCHFTPFCDTMYPLSSGMCPPAQLSSITPNEGPNLGGTLVSISGTNLGIQSSDVLSVTIGDSTCDIDYSEYIPGKRIVCRTRGNLLDVFEIEVRIKGNILPIRGLEYTYSEPKVFELEPNLGPISGGTLVTFRGEKLLIGTETTVRIGTTSCEVQLQLSSNEVLVCRTQSVTSQQMTTILLKIDDVMISVSEDIDGVEIGLLRYTYLPDPTVTMVTPSSMFPSGGLSLLIHGTNFHGIQNADLMILYNNNNNNNNNDVRKRREVYLTECGIIDDTSLTCPTPELQIEYGTNQTGTELTFNLILDSVPNIVGIGAIEFMLHPDPIFTPFEKNLTQDSTQPIIIMGENFLLNELQLEHIVITADERKCETKHIQEELVICYLEDIQGNEGPLFIKARVGNIETRIGYLTLTQEFDLIRIILPAVIGLLCVVFCGIGLLALIIFRNVSKKKDVRLSRLMKNLEELEMGVAQESKKGFTELQTCVEEFDQDLTGGKLPFLDLKTYLMSILFPEGGPFMPGLKYRSNKFIHTAKVLPSFKELLLNEEFLLQFISVMEKQTDFVVKEKCKVASLLIVCLMSEMDYTTHILKQLLGQLIDKSLVRQHSKMLLRRTDSVGEKLLTNWLAICLYRHIKDHVGTPLYRLSRALKMQLEKGPIDVVNGEARYSLSEEKLLRHVIQEEKLNCYLDTGEGNGMPITFLDCDSIGQTKEKALDAMYKGRAVCERPSLVDVELEYTRNRLSNSPMVLRDIDSSNETEKGWIRINTLKHYKIESGAYFQLRTRTESTKCDYVGTIISVYDKKREQNLEDHLWHLSKPDDAESNSSSSKEKMASEIYLHRLLYSKNVLQNFVNDLFENILNVNNGQKEGYPLAIRYFFQVLEEQATKHNITDVDTIQTWKNNGLALRFWVNLIKNPEFVFNIYKSSTMDSCLLVIAQTFMDSFSVSNTKLNKDSPTSKLLYAREVRKYKQSVANYYEDIRKLPRVSEEEMTEEMNSLSKNLKKEDMLDTEEALYQLFRYANKYSTQLYDNLIEDGYNSLANHFKEILDQLEVNNNNSNTTSPYLSSHNNRQSPYPVNNNNNNRLSNSHQNSSPFENNKFQSSV